MDWKGCNGVRWTVDTETQELTMAVTSAPSADWVAIGISEHGGMKGADIALIKMTASGDFGVEDLFSDEYQMPRQDVVQNVELLSAIVDYQDRISAVIRRPLFSCDEDDLDVTPNGQSIVCASGLLNSAGEPIYHGSQRSEATVNLVVDFGLLFFQLDFNPSPVCLVDDVVVAHDDPDTATSPFPVDIQMPHVSLNNTKRTTYLCHIFEMPMDMNILGFEAVWNRELRFTLNQDNHRGFITKSFATLQISESGGTTIHDMIRSNKGSHTNRGRTGFWIGIRTTVKLIRDGVHIANVYETKSYDFALQTLKRGLWKLLPGDAIVVSCFYRPRTDHDVVGGFSTSDEMCDLFFAQATEVEEFNVGIGFLVEPNQPFLNCFAGTNADVGRSSETITYSQALYAPDSRNFVPLKNHGRNLCDLIVRDSFKTPRSAGPPRRFPHRHTYLPRSVWLQLPQF